ncbi:MAG: hypothetical protein ACK53Y_23575, partial [bacterium]
MAATDASKLGMGGFWVSLNPATNTLQHFLWRAPFSKLTQDSLVSDANPAGLINNSELELAALLTGAILAAQFTATLHPNIALASDNTPAIAWAT